MSELYPDAQAARTRYLRITDSFEAQYGQRENALLFSVPGRIEVSGNHTDHQRGHVLAAAVTLDAVAVASANDENTIRVYSEGFGEIKVSLDNLNPLAAESGSSAALIRGITARFREMGYKVGGLDAYVSSDVLPGSGMSSSAAFEVLVGAIINGLYNAENIDPVTLAQIGQYAENVYFGKPSGLMDQCACAVGGFCAIDFTNPDAPVVESVPCEIGSFGYTLCLIDAGGSHANLTDEYAAIPAEMRSVAAYFGKDVLSQVSRAEFEAALCGGLRGSVSDRAILRALHFFNEDFRAVEQAKALRVGDFDAFLRGVRESGRSSMNLLQNVYPSGNINERSLSLAFAVCEDILGDSGAWRMNGGGFAGTVLVFVPTDRLESFREKTEGVFGFGACHVLQIRPSSAEVPAILTASH
ncbi:MAG: galactokinase [Oscillospiraceae bacterium]|nr:galactokinase [Oscillospiraceae bacterium]